MIDSYNRKIDYMRISVTDRCNLRCVYCMPEEGVENVTHNEILRYEEILKIVRIAVKNGVSKVRITGGEPLVRKGIVDFIKELAKVKGICDLCLTTNGVLLKEMAGQLYDAGLKRVNISLDSLKRERFHEITRKDFLPRILEGLEELEKYPISPIKINNVAIRGFNEDEILDFAMLARERPFQVRFIEFMPIDGERFWSSEKCIPFKEIISKIETFKKLIPLKEPLQNGGPAKMYTFEDGIGEIGFINPISCQEFCSSCTRLRLTADGNLMSCLFSNKEYNVKKILREGGDEEQIKKLLSQIVKEKPEKHFLNDHQIIKRCNRGMSLIGG
jgi:cyclic pyranopterin phosphate synthase